MNPRRGLAAIVALALGGCVVPDSDNPPLGTDSVAEDDTGAVEDSGDAGPRQCFELPSCDPLSPDCAGTELCIAVEGGFECVLPVESTTQVPIGEPCTGALSCQEGAACLPVAIPGCSGAPGCCVALCELEAPDCPGGAVCTPFFDEGGPSCFASVGVCADG